MGHLLTVARHQRGIAKHAACRAVGDDPSCVDQDHPRAKLQHQFQIMAGDQHRLIHAAQQVDQPPAVAQVKCC